MSNTEIEFNITDTINNNVSSIKIVNDDTIFNLMGKICLVYNEDSKINVSITPDFLYVYDDDGPINFKYTNKDIKYPDPEKDKEDFHKADLIFYKNGKSYRQDLYDLSTKLIHSKFIHSKFKKKVHTLKVVCLLDILKEEEITTNPSEYYHGFIKKYWPNIKKKKV